jgi:thiol-disulfide isomerase/thioredoxin
MILRTLLLLLCALPVSANEWLTRWDAAQAVAQKTGRPILIDFQAVWCYSCYYMDENVLETKPFLAAAKDLVLLKLDVDTVEGRQMRERYKAGFLPSYVLVDNGGKALGRIVGERTRPEFMRLLSDLRNNPRDDDAYKLGALLDAGDLDIAQAFRDKTVAANKNLSKRADWRLLSRRLDLRRAAKLKHFASARSAFGDLLALEKGCLLAYDVFRALPAVQAGDKEERAQLLRRAYGAMQALVTDRVFGTQEQRCADTRSAVSALGGILQAQGDTLGQKGLMKRAINLLSARQQKIGLGEDRNLDDDLRYFLNSVNDTAVLDGMYPRLIAAYPADYVYAYRWAKSLHGRARSSEALPLIEKAFGLSYGKNRLSVARVQAEVLVAVGRAPEARALLQREIRVNKKRFPKAIVALEAALKKLGT